MTILLRIPLLALVIGVLASCSVEAPPTTILNYHPSDGIINGTQANADAAISRSTVKIGLPSGKLCSGVLLNDHVVLTAAHCVNRAVAGPTMTVVVPETDRSCFAASVTEISLAPMAAPGNKFLPDLALLKLSRAICNTAPVVLAPKVVVGDRLESAGFGEGTFGGLPYFLTMKVIHSDKNYFQELYLNDYPDDAEVLSDWKILSDIYEEFSETYLFALAINSQQTTCFGDSGGPVFQEHNGVLTIFGVIGGGIPHSKKGVPACQNTYLQFFTPLGPSMEWLENTLQSW